MLIEINGNDLVNKGAEMMSCAILQRASNEFNGVKFAMAPNFHVPSYEKRTSLGLYQKVWLRRYRMQWGYYGSLIPKKIRDMYGLVLDREVDVVLDASGFGYTDVWGAEYSCLFAKASKRWKRQGTKIVMLPQAFGPFTSVKIKEAIITIVDNADLIFAREQVSFDHLKGVVGERPNIKIAPDFTNLLDGVIPDNYRPQKKSVCIIPNFRMIDRTSPEVRSAYIPFLVTCIQYLQKVGAKPFILIHEGDDDLKVAQKIVSKLNKKITIMNEANPLKIKGILGTCHATIGSRYHGLVSSLSQSVPSLATCWSHKYKILFEDYSFIEGIISPTDDDVKIRQKIDLIIDDGNNAEIKKRLRLKSGILKVQTQDMWQDVFTVFN